MASPENSNLRALVVDDDETFVDYIAHLMHKMGYAVERSFDGLDALKRCQSSHYDIVVCDVRMPRLSGLSFLSNLSRATAAMPKCIMVSAFDDNALRRQAFASGASAYLVKPIEAQALRDAVGPPLSDGADKLAQMP
ncbi:MAG: response regulator [Betaproteobacteria bacterium]